MNGTTSSPSPVKKLVVEPLAEETAIAGIGYRREAYDEISGGALSGSAILTPAWDEQ